MTELIDLFPPDSVVNCSYSSDVTCSTAQVKVCMLFRRMALYKFAIELNCELSTTFFLFYCSVIIVHCHP